MIVKPTEIDDDAATLLSHEIAREIEDNLEYPGQVKVTVIRESRHRRRALAALPRAPPTRRGPRTPSRTRSAGRACARSQPPSVPAASA